MRFITNSICSLSPLLISATMVCMDQPLQHFPATQYKVVQSTLCIDHKPTMGKTYTIEEPVMYLTKENRQTYPHTKHLENKPLNTPFLAIIIKDLQTGEKIRTIIPAPQLINCDNGSTVDLKRSDCIFHLRCLNNNKLTIKSKHFPKDGQKNNFHSQFLGCMNQFYSKNICLGKNMNEEDLIQQKILYMDTKQIIQMSILGGTPGHQRVVQTRTLARTTYRQGPKGCATPENLIKLATNPTTRNSGYSTFRYVMNRQHTRKALPQIKKDNTTEAGRVKCYYNYLENVQHVGIKSPMPKTTHSFKSPSLDVTNRIPMSGEEAPAQNTILDDCLAEFATREREKEEELNSLLEDCLTEFAIQEKKVAENNSRPQRTRDFIGNECALL